MEKLFFYFVLLSVLLHSVNSQSTSSSSLPFSTDGLTLLQVGLGSSNLTGYQGAWFNATALSSTTGLLIDPTDVRGSFVVSRNGLPRFDNYYVSSGNPNSPVLYLPPSFVSGSVLVIVDFPSKNITITERPLVNVSLPSLSVSGNVISTEVAYYYYELTSTSYVSLTFTGYVQVTLWSGRTVVSGINPNIVLQRGALVLPAATGTFYIAVSGIDSPNGGAYSFNVTINALTTAAPTTASPALPNITLPFNTHNLQLAQASLGNNYVGTYNGFWFNATSLVNTGLSITVNSSSTKIFYVGRNIVPEDSFFYGSNVALGRPGTPLYLPPSFVDGGYIVITDVQKLATVTITSRPLVNQTLSPPTDVSGNVLSGETAYYNFNVAALSVITVTSSGSPYVCLRSVNQGGVCGENETITLINVNGTFYLTVTGVSSQLASFSLSIAIIAVPPTVPLPFNTDGQLLKQLELGSNDLQYYTGGFFNATSWSSTVGLLVNPGPLEGSFVVSRNNIPQAYRFNSNNIYVSYGSASDSVLYLPPSFVAGAILVIEQLPGNQVNLTERPLVNETLTGSTLGANGTVIGTETAYYNFQVTGGQTVKLTFLGYVQVCLQTAGKREVCADGGQRATGTLSLSDVTGQVNVIVSGVYVLQNGLGSYSFTVTL